MAPKNGKGNFVNDLLRTEFHKYVPLMLSECTLR